MNPTLTLHKEKKPGFLTLGEAFDHVRELFSDFAEDMIAEYKNRGAGEEEIALARIHLAEREAAVLEKLFAPLLVTRH